MAKRSRNINLESSFYCTICGRQGIPIPRKKGAEREAGHLKKLWCLTCKKETNHAECKEFSHYSYEDFKIELENNNFDETGLRKMTYGELKQKLNNQKREGITE